MAIMSNSTELSLLTRIEEAINAHDLEALVGCFSPNYRAEIPNHPARSFSGADQVRRNWVQIFAAVPGITATLLASASNGPCVWGEWRWDGTRADSDPFAMAGVTIIEVEGDRVASARFYMEPVEAASGDVAADVRRVTGQGTGAR